MASDPDTEARSVRNGSLVRAQSFVDLAQPRATAHHDIARRIRVVDLDVLEVLQVDGDGTILATESWYDC